MRELHRVMKPSGWGIFQVPQDLTREITYEDPTITSPEEREKHFWQKDHVRLFGLDYPEWLKRAGFEVDRKSTRLNSSHVRISYAVFCLKKKKKQNNYI